MVEVRTTTKGRPMQMPVTPYDTGDYVLIANERWMAQFLGYTSTGGSGLFLIIEVCEVVYIPLDFFGSMVEKIPVGQANYYRKNVAGIPDWIGKNGYQPPTELPE